MPSPGDRVVIILDALSYNTWGDYFVLVATKGSIARAMSFDEYCDFYNQYRPDGFSILADSPKEVRKWMDKEHQFPFRFESVEPPAIAPSFSGEYRDVSCKVGGVIVLDSRFFRVIE
jgi:hypothetical protein